MGDPIIIDPVTRIEGHLRADVNVDGGVVNSAQVSGTMARGIEALLVGRDPRDATYVTERICGVCFGAHGWTSCLAVEQAHGMGPNDLPEAARLLRNLLVGACWLHDHPLHFYHLSALDYLDLSVLTGYTGDDPNIIQIRDLILNGTAGPLTPFYAPDAYSINDLGLVVLAVQHYLEALTMQAKAKKMSALLAGKQPHQSGMVVGGVTQLPDDNTLALFETMLTEQIDFINNVYVSDVLTLAQTAWLWPLAISDVGVGHQNYLSYGGFPEGDGSFLYPEGAIVDGSLVASSRSAIEADLSEDVTNSWYDSGTGGHPADTEQIFDLNSGGYSFVKAPRFQGNPMEVGPLARMLVAVNRPQHPAHSHAATQTLMTLLGLGVQPNAVARHAARALETQILCDAMGRWLGELRDLMANVRGKKGVEIHSTQHWDPPTQPGDNYGVGMTEAPRGSLAHWVKIVDNGGPTKEIGRYACVVPTTWNASPGNGPYEEALIGCPVPDEANPINVVRIIRSFDPCIACAVHVITPKGDTKKFVVDI